MTENELLILSFAVYAIQPQRFSFISQIILNDKHNQENKLRSK
jgi:hypothetical protein